MEYKRVLQDSRHVTQGSDMLRGVRACCEGCEHVAHGAGMLRAVRARRRVRGRHAAHGTQECRGRCRYVTYGPRHLMRNADTLCMAQARYVRCRRVARQPYAKHEAMASRGMSASRTMHLQLVRMLHTPTQREWITHGQAALIFPCRSQRLRRRQRPQGLRLCQRSQGTPHLEQPQSAPRRRRSQSAVRLRLPPGAPYCERPQGLIRHQRSKSLPCRH